MDDGRSMSEGARRRERPTNVDCSDARNLQSTTFPSHRIGVDAEVKRRFGKRKKDPCDGVRACV